MNRSVPVGAVRPFGDRAFLIGVEDPSAGRALEAALDEQSPWTGGAFEFVGAFATVLVTLRAPDLDPAAVEAWLMDRAGARRRITDVGVTRSWRVPCFFDGPDLDEVATWTGCSADEVIALLTGAELRVAVVGFSPGFAYLSGLPDVLRAVPRRTSPRPTVPPGSLALAGGHCAVYPTASPGGWQLVGRTGFSFFQADSRPYATVAPGDAVRVVAAGPADPVAPAPLAPPSWTAPPSARPVLEVIVPGVRAVLQDAGRPDVAGVGVPEAAPADPTSFLLANRLVGNRDRTGTVELLLGGSTLRCVEACHVAAVGGAPELRIDGVAVPDAQVLPLLPGQHLVVGSLRRGLRTYLAVAGGLVGPEVCASVASDELCALGPGPLQRGEVLYAGPWEPPLGDHLVPGVSTSVEAGGVCSVRVVAGPHVDHFRSDVLTHLAAARWRVRAESNRVGLRLESVGDAVVAGGAAQDSSSFAVEGARELDSQGMVTGAVQLPPGGEPVILGPDHATLGGYPVAAVVIGADLGLLGQCGPGTEVRLVPVTVGEAREAWATWRRVLDGAVQGHYPLTAG
jgi:biotin-dependent carboxylase-like uncharacterized protein